MKLPCPACGAICSAETWMNDSNCRETLVAISRLPGPVAKVALSYMSLFRPAKSALSWKKALRLALEIEELVGKGFVSRQGCIDRDCSPGTWGKAMEVMIEQRHSLTTPMASHNYLRKVAYDLAEQADRTGESKRPNRISAPRIDSDPSPIGVVLSPMKQWHDGLREDKPTQEEMDQWNIDRMK